MLWIALALPLLPNTVKYFMALWSLEHYQFFPFAVAAVVWLAVVRHDRVLRMPSGKIAWAGCLSAWALGAASVWLNSPWIGVIAAVLLAFAFLASQRGRNVTTLAALAIPLLTVIRFPFNLDQVLVLRLQTVTTQLSSLVLDLLGVPHAVSGNVLQLADQELFVAEACSGIQSVFTLTFLACLIVAGFRRRAWLLPVYLGIAMFLAVAGNVLRVSIVAAGEAWSDLNLTAGFLHDCVGYFTLAVSALFLLSFDRLLCAFLHSTESAQATVEGNPVVQLWNWLTRTETSNFDSNHSDAITPVNARAHSSFLFSKPLVPAIVLGIGAVTCMAASGAVFDLFGQRNLESTLDLKQVVFELPDSITEEPFRVIKPTSHRIARGGSDPRLGENADLWEFDTDSSSGQLVVSQPFDRWHEICFCYEIQDWLLLDRKIERFDENGESNLASDTVPVATAIFTKDGGLRGYLFYTAVTASGSPISPPDFVGSRLLRRLTNLGTDPSQSSEQVMMLQIWVAAREKLSPATVRNLKLDLFDFRKRVIDSMEPELSTNAPLNIVPDIRTNKE